jgi:ubiquinone/menaquinone biosynthesis C-methylase UbiE
MVLKPSEAQAFYDRFGKKQDTQGFYEDPAIDDLLAQASFSAAKSVFEFGCGTGRLAARLLKDILPEKASYAGCDLSRTMVDVATQRIAPYARRAQVFQADISALASVPAHSVDRVISTYVLDLMSEADIAEFLREANRILPAGGKVCLVSLTRGVTLPSRIVVSIWSLIFRLRASLVSGCRPIILQRHINPKYWQMEYRNVIVAFGVPSEVLVAQVKH